MDAKLSIWSFYYYDLSPEEAVKEFKKHGIHCYELASEHGAQLLSRGDPETVGKQFCEFLKSENFNASQGHLWLGCRLSGEKEQVNELLRWIRLYDAAGVENAVLHLDGMGESPELTKQEKYEKNIEVLKWLQEQMKGMKIRLCLENLTRFAESAEELLAVLGELDSERFGICLDTGHLNLCNPDQAAFIRKAGSRLHALHIADNEGTIDQHMMPFGRGHIDFSAVVSALREIDYCGLFNYEIPGESRIPFEVRGYKLDYIKKAYDYLMRS